MYKLKKKRYWTNCRRHLSRLRAMKSRSKIPIYAKNQHLQKLSKRFWSRGSSGKHARMQIFAKHSIVSVYFRYFNEYRSRNDKSSLRGRLTENFLSLRTGPRRRRGIKTAFREENLTPARSMTISKLFSSSYRSSIVSNLSEYGNY